MAGALQASQSAPGSAGQPIVSLAVCDSSPTSCQPPQTPVSARDAQVAIDTSIRLFCAASSSQLNASKSQAFLVQSQPLASATINALPSIRFITGQQTVKHLGVRLGYDMSAACHQTFTSIHQAIKAKLRATLKTLLPCPPQPPRLPCSLGAHQLLAPCPRGVGLVEVPTQIQALQAKVVSRLLEPERLAWKVFQLHHLSDAPRTRALAYGATILFSTISIGCLQLPARLTGYVLAFRALRPHRLLKINAMPAEDVLNEPIFYNRQVSVPLGSSATGSATDSTASRPLTPHDQPLLLATGITKVAHLQAALQQQQPAAFTACLQSVLMTMPPPWRAIATAAPTAPAWRQGLSASGSQLIQNTQTGQHHLLKSHDQLQSPMLRLSQLPPLCMSFLGTLLDLGGVQHSNQLGQLLHFIHKAAVGSQTFVSGGMGLGTAACPPTDSAAGKPALAADPSPAAWHPDSRALVCRPRFLPLPGQTKVQLRSCKNWNPGGQLPCKPAQPAGLVPAQTC
ncbi:TPA: hypothetical protein ACH3X1_001129 [Trebouxia sp. C0004]